QLACHLGGILHGRINQHRKPVADDQCASAQHRPHGRGIGLAPIPISRKVSHRNHVPAFHLRLGISLPPPSSLWRSPRLANRPPASPTAPTTPPKNTGRRRGPLNKFT